jgi:hypothetical protein
MVVIIQPVEYSLDNVDFRILYSRYIQDSTNLPVTLIEPSYSAAVNPEDVTVWLPEFVFVTILNSDLRFAAGCQRRSADNGVI